MSKIFSIKRQERVDYYVDWDRQEVIDTLASFLSQGDPDEEQRLTVQYEKASDEELLAYFSEELEEYGGVYDYVIDRSEKYGDVQYNDVSVTLEEEVN